MSKRRDEDWREALAAAFSSETEHAEALALPSTKEEKENLRVQCIVEARQAAKEYVGSLAHKRWEAVIITTKSHDHACLCIFAVQPKPSTVH